MAMRISLVWAFAAVTIIAARSITQGDDGLPPPVMASAHLLLQQAAVVCGNTGCAPVQTKRIQKQRTPVPWPPRQGS